MRAGDLLGERRQAFLGGGGARRRQRQARQHRLLAAVERGQRVHEGLVLQQLVAVVVAEAGAAAQADAGGAGGGLGDQVGIEHDLDHAAHRRSRRGRAAAAAAARSAEIVTCSAGDISSWSSSSAIEMKCRAASRVVGPSPGSGSSGLPNRRIECSVTAGVPSASSSSAAIAQLRADSTQVAGRAGAARRPRRRSRRARARTSAEVQPRVVDLRQRGGAARVVGEELHLRSPPASSTSVSRRMPRAAATMRASSAAWWAIVGAAGRRWRPSASVVSMRAVSASRTCRRGAC